MNILGTRIDNISLRDCLIRISEALAKGGEMRIVTANPELIYRAQNNRELLKILESADMVLPDGIGVVWAAKQLGQSLKERVTGIDLTIKILEEGDRREWRIFMLGAKPGIAEKAVIKQSEEYPGIIFGAHHGYFTKDEEPSVVDKIKCFKPDILLVGLGAPKQEIWNYRNEGIAKVRIGVGGTIDILAGQVQRASKFFQEHHLEWLYRLLKEPSRISRQRILPLYVMKVLQTKYFN
ncbi:MAG: N-acetylglucosaminyldiphosphoundecaprenol N-acetyl-beta-D-mannosaminyltransferase [Candidatus Dichloromethanomonas elyunquensis]|nr:MAG: N-acetylglucosaminyldiphosphoundecaprenol N-acetyl-beta-D-mannosaminyltransferase [Candidatus Dichloromethanomonas elyunquensis]